MSSDGKMLNLVLQHENEQTAKATKTAKEIKKKAKWHMDSTYGHMYIWTYGHAKDISTTT